MRFALFFLCIFFSLDARVQTIINTTARVVTARIFIHGTILGGYFFINPKDSWNDQYREESLMGRAMASARKHHFLHQSELVLDMGMVDVTEEVTTALSTPLHDERAAIAILRAFERTDQCVNDRSMTKHKYYTFGWSGALSERKRNKESHHLYHALITLQKELQKQHPDHIIRFEIYAHSHGGQLIAHLPTVHKGFPENDLFIDLAVLCATPLYKEKVQPMISSSMFGTIISLYSHGDTVQNLDIVSTPQHYCVRHLQELEIPLPAKHVNGPRIIDIRMTVYHNPKVFDHHSFFSLSTYSLPSYFHKRSHIRKTLDLFAPLPVLALMPACINNINKLDLQKGFNAVTLNFEKRHNCLHLETYHSCDPSVKSKDLFKIKPLSKKFTQEYKHRARSSASNQLHHAFYHIFHN